jgi:hypothetical protein
VVSGQNENAGHFPHPTAMAMGQIVMWFTPFNKELERTPVKAIIQELQLLGCIGVWMGLNNK